MLPMLDDVIVKYGAIVSPAVYAPLSAYSGANAIRVPAKLLTVYCAPLFSKVCAVEVPIEVLVITSLKT
jgi:hypothetical protein